jgi:hypothetical protein
LVHTKLEVICFTTTCQYESGFVQYTAKGASVGILNIAPTMSYSLGFFPIFGEFVIKSEIVLSVMQGKY